MPLIIRVDAYIEIESKLMTKDDYIFLHNDPDLLLERLEENPEEFLEELGGIRALVKSIAWRE